MLRSAGARRTIKSMGTQKYKRKDNLDLRLRSHLLKFLATLQPEVIREATQGIDYVCPESIALSVLILLSVGVVYVTRSHPINTLIHDTPIVHRHF
jgi:hypothetical protein